MIIGPPNQISEIYMFSLKENSFIVINYFVEKALYWASFIILQCQFIIVSHNFGQDFFWKESNMMFLTCYICGNLFSGEIFCIADKILKII